MCGCGRTNYDIGLCFLCCSTQDLLFILLYTLPWLACKHVLGTPQSLSPMSPQRCWDHYVISFYMVLGFELMPSIWTVFYTLGHLPSFRDLWLFYDVCSLLFQRVTVFCNYLLWELECLNSDISFKWKWQRHTLV